MEPARDDVKFRRERQASCTSRSGPPPPIDNAIDEIRRLVDVGVTHFEPAFRDMATLRRFIDDVLPAVA